MPKYIDADAFIGWARTRYCKDCDKRKGMKNGKMRFVYDIGSAPCRSCDVDDMVEDVDNFPAADVEDGKRAAWISVKERLPDIDQIVLTYSNDRGAEYKVLRRAFSDLYKAAGLGDGWYWESIDYMTEYPDEFGNGEVTHWMPLPEPPEVEE